ncbi:MAG: RNA polymerase subunit sigma-70 [Nocardioides sp.]
MHPMAPTADDLEVLRGPLTGFCYRMLGSAADTDDAAQETIIRAHRHLDRFDPSRAALSTWVHGIATNVCLDMLRSARRRELLAPVPASTPGAELGGPITAEAWLEPMPDSRTVHASDPAELLSQRESVRLAFLAALQYLTPRPRAVLLLRDVYAFTAQETAAALGMSVAATNSALQRSRATLAAHRPAPNELSEPDSSAERDLLARYIDAFQSHDVVAMRALLHEDVISSMPPFAWWLSGRNDVAAVFDASDSCVGDRLMPIRVNATMGFAQYRPAADGVLLPFAIAALYLRDGLVAHSVTFLGTGPRFAEFGLPKMLAANR